MKKLESAWRVGCGTAAVVLIASIPAVHGWTTRSAHHDDTLADTGQVSATDTATAAVEARFRSAVEAERTIEEPATPLSVQAALTADRPVDVASSSSLEAPLIATSQRLISANFTGAAAAFETKQMSDSAATAVTPGQYMQLLGAGVTDLTFNSVDVRATTANVTATVSVWQTLRSRGLTGPHHTLGPWFEHTARNKETFVATLSQVGSTWLVSQSSWTYVPGYGP